MLESMIVNLIEREETLWLEFKSYWYWDSSEKKLDLGLIEFLKDFAAMFNTIGSHQENERYIILGFDEKTKEHNDFYLDKNGNLINYLKDITELKKDLVKKIKKRFQCFPDYKNSNDLVDLDKYFDLKEIEINGKKNLIFVIHKSPYLLKLKSDLGDGVKSGNILVRGIKNDKTPENIICDFEKTEELLGVLNKIKENKFPKNETTIRKIVEAFKNKHMPYAEYDLDEVERNYTTGICFEIFKIKGEYASSITFVYFTSYTTQSKTLEYLIESEKLSKGERGIVLLDRHNKSGGIIDIKRIEELFKGQNLNFEFYYMEEFSLEKLYQELLDNDVFYQGQSLTSNFVKPYTMQSDEKTADMLLNEWYENNDNPLLVLKGSGGVGKTTVAKYFIETVYKIKRKNNVNILYINSHDIINEIMKKKNIEDVFDFYMILAEKKNVSKRFSKELLGLSSDNGNVVIVLDGIDEVIAKKGSDFNLNNLINSIFRHYSGNLNKTKIIMTCRDFFWDSSNSSEKVKTIELKPFDEVLAKKYFEKSFNGDIRKIKESMTLAENFQVKGGDKNLYVPYMLDMIKDNIISMDNNVRLDIKTEILQYLENIDDYLIAKSCEREIKKLENLEIDEQIKIFVRIAVDFEGIIHQDQLEKILKTIHADKNLDKFKDHPLLIKDHNLLSFRYDFFITHFKCIALYNFLKNKEISSMDSSISELFIQYIDFDNEFTKNLKFRLGNGFSEKMKEDFYFLTNGEYKLNAVDVEKIIEVKSSLFTLVLSFFNNLDRESRTEMLKEIYLNDDYIENLNIINLHSKNKNLIFDFSDLKFNNCIFENYENFSECIFNENTIFKNTVFKPNLARKDVITNICRKNIDFSTCKTIGVDELLEHKEALNEQASNEVRKNLKRILSYFWHGGYFTNKLASEANNRFKNINNTFQSLIDLNVIRVIRITTSQKRQDLAYRISDDYINLRKIFEENETCVEFEVLVKSIS